MQTDHALHEEIYTLTTHNFSDAHMQGSMSKVLAKRACMAGNVYEQNVHDVDLLCALLISM